MAALVATPPSTIVHPAVHLRPIAANARAGPSNTSSMYLNVDVPQPRRSLPNIKSPGGSTMKVEYACRRCRARIAQRSSVVSWDFRGDTGRAALFTEAENISLAKMSVMLMHTGAYRVQNTLCAACGESLGWKFVRASEKTEKWKEGYFILELNLLEEEAFPLSPYDEVQLPFTYKNVVGSRLSGLEHRRSASSLSSVSMDRQRPHGPRQKKDL